MYLILSWLTRVGTIALTVFEVNFQWTKLNLLSSLPHMHYLLSKQIDMPKLRALKNHFRGMKSSVSILSWLKVFFCKIWYFCFTCQTLLTLDDYLTINIHCLNTSTPCVVIEILFDDIWQLELYGNISRKI